MCFAVFFLIIDFLLLFLLVSVHQPVAVPSEKKASKIFSIITDL